MNGITIEQIRELAANEGSVRVTRHVLKRFRERGINLDDVLNVLLNGKIIEQYPTDYPYPSCLELGTAINGKALHVCVGVGEGKIFIITAYFPSLDEWEFDLRTRKAVK